MEIKPDHYYEGKDGIPVFKPTYEQFKNFKEFIMAVRPYGMNSGIVKIIPPKEWTDTLPKDLSVQLEKIVIDNPIKQEFTKVDGKCRVKNMDTNTKFTVKKWALLCSQPDHATPIYESQFLPTKPTKKTGKKRKISLDLEEGSRSLKSDLHQINKSPRTDNIHNITSRPRDITAAEKLPEVTRDSVPTSSNTSKNVRTELHVMNNESDGCETEEEVEEVLLTSENMSDTSMGIPKDVSEHVYSKKAEKIEKAFNHSKPKWNYKVVTRGLPFDNDDYIRDLEHKYWKNLAYFPPYYGADLDGSLFTDATTIWNVNKIDNLLNLMDPIPGVNKAYLYFGMWKASFAWHVEDKDLYSINYIHFGAPKFWYAISPQKASTFEQKMKGWFPGYFYECSEFLRHKEFMASPEQLRNGIMPFGKMVQREGEFIITFPRGYHAGFNMGFNCAESVNFAFEDWIEMGVKAKSCECNPDSVTIDVNGLFGHLLKQPVVEGSYSVDKNIAASAVEAPLRTLPKMKGSRKMASSNTPSPMDLDGPVSLMYPEHNYVTPSPDMIVSPSNKQKTGPHSKSRNQEQNSPREVAKMKSPRKKNSIDRHTTVNNEIFQLPRVGANEIDHNNHTNKKMEKVETKNCNYTDRCALCPVVGVKSDIMDERFEMVYNKEYQLVHRFCALFVPGMFISANENYDNNEVATDYRDAPYYKKYKDLKCEVCSIPSGSCTLCPYPNCQRSYHVLCSIDIDCALYERQDAVGGIHYEIWCPNHIPVSKLCLFY
ncbi:JmjC domain, hydroxylase-domain-containing protein [Glomus cerebriforme]|uniref:[histone H3]-trimethyl-L-lysine(9) demethylase n=1 Tax=Glomus cerebriforme TaxID=658196 RepID=A0A397TVK8_9GLOM|nr:JmjC domain, hydroxylase-domain-containing protein [Glomus cerebriforme]